MSETPIRGEPNYDSAERPQCNCIYWRKAWFTKYILVCACNRRLYEDYELDSGKCAYCMLNLHKLEYEKDED